MLTIETIQKALALIEEPESHQNVASLGWVKKIQVDEGDVTLVVELQKPTYLPKDELERRIVQTLKKSEGVKDVSVIFTAAPIRPERTPPAPMKIPGVKNVIAVYACKGGVGKSTVSTNLASGLATLGYAVGLLDADVHGPNVPLMMGLEGYPRVSDDNKITPLFGHNVKVMSLGFLQDVKVPLIWRGPMVHGAVQQLLRDTAWGDLDFLVIDLPPGTGDAQLTIIQSVPLAGVLFVTTPQTVSLLDGVKGIKMFQKLEVPILGILENMSGFTCPHCQTTTNIFSKGGGESEAKQWNIPFLGSVPLDPAIVTGGDTGQPIVVGHPDSPSSQVLMKMAEQVASTLSKKNLNPSSTHDNFDLNLSNRSRGGA